MPGKRRPGRQAAERVSARGLGSADIWARRRRRSNVISPPKLSEIELYCKEMKGGQRRSGRKSEEGGGTGGGSGWEEGGVNTSCV